MEINKMKFWMPKNNEWNNFAIYQDGKEVMRGEVSTTSTLDTMTIWLKGYSNLTKDEIYKVVEMFKKEFIKIEPSVYLTMNAEIKIMILVNNKWLEI